jgi:hypothetical protein
VKYVNSSISEAYLVLIDKYGVLDHALRNTGGKTSLTKDRLGVQNKIIFRTEEPKETLGEWELSAPNSETEIEQFYIK